MASVKERLLRLYQAARDGEREYCGYIDYCNTPINGRTSGDYMVTVSRFDRRYPEYQEFDVRNITEDAFLDRVATWLVTGEVTETGGPSDPLEW